LNSIDVSQKFEALILFFNLNSIYLYRAETPPNTPQRARATARENDRNNRNLDSPEQRRIPHNPVFAPIAPLYFNNVPFPQVAPFPGNVIVQDDPFALPLGPAQINGQQQIH
jgi:hypothetical protein